MRQFFFFLLTSSVLLAVASLPPLERKDPALYEVASVPNRPEVPGYTRDAFGAAWSAPPSGPCNTRIWLIQQSLEAVDLEACALKSGEGKDPYSGRRIGINPADAPEGARELERIEVDHVFPLSAAWDLGAHQWSAATRLKFANDPLNLVAVSRSQNQDKGDQLPSQWLPQRRNSRCWYVNRMAKVALAYDLPLPEADLKAMHRQCLLPAPRSAAD